MEKVLKDISLDKLPEVANSILSYASEFSIWKFEGNLGAGKTTLIKELCRQLGVKQPVQSPTFSIVNTYEGKEGKELFHFDCYRLNKQEEAFDFGIEEYLDSGSLCFIEWPQIIDNLLPIPHLLVKLETTLKKGSRKITLKIIS